MLRDKEILLRPLVDTDKAAMAALLNNKNVSGNLRNIIRHPYTESDAQWFIDLTRNENPRVNFVIEYNGELCGLIGLSPRNDVYHQTAEIGYWIGEPFWGKGIATRTVKLITAYGFDQLGFVRIHTGVIEFNPASMRVLEKNGYEKEGIFRKSITKNGRLWDEHRYGITK
jgi:[ribosomal protein S5]-alanine N-acetyltransferase